ncbi:MAG: hypothetical protein HKM06_08300 [Spirochaetales bacterium]|nr:hypothetical protein [Spirochaetales bacterium]
MSEKFERLRNFVQSLQGTPLEKPWSEEAWQKITENNELTPDDLRQLEVLRRGHESRAQRSWSQLDTESALEEWTQVLLLGPQDLEFEQEVHELVQSSKEPSVKTFAQVLQKRRSGPPKKSLFATFWFVPILVLALGGIFALGLFHPFDPGAAFRSSSLKESSAQLKLAVDTSGIECQVKTIKCHLLLYPDAKVAEVLAKFTFPDQAISSWKVDVMVLDANKKVLATRSVVVRKASDGPLLAGQSIDFFQQFDAQGWSDQANEIFVKTSQILTLTDPHVLSQPVELKGADSLPDGEHVSALLEKTSWRSLFDKQVEDVDLSITNTGLRSIPDLQVTAVWLGPNGTVWKMMKKTAVSPFRSPLASGEKVSVHWQAEFPLEIYPIQEKGQPSLEFHIRSVNQP